MGRKALDFAHWFVRCFTLSQAWSDQAKLQKLLFFSWLIHFVNHKSSLFEDDFCAFEYGPVVWDILYMQPIEYENLLAQSLPKYTAEELDTLNLTYEIFGDADALELIDLSHQSPAWEKYYNESMIYENGKFVGYDREKQIISKEELDAELNMMRNLLYAHENREELGY
ncbi:MAG: Panacea domain-containing protein [Methanimicrococcus sp.]|nr:Panacea domain-containing protein [Methanimicrococcus sp.]